MALERVRSYVSPIVKPPLRRVRYRTADLIDRVRPTGRSGELLPPLQLRKLNGHRDFATMGRAIADDLVRLAGVGEGDSVLDVGCGSGRVALPLIDLIGPEGSYEGFDIVPEAVAWCQRRVTPVHPNFQFQLADVRNPHYHPRGSQEPEEYRFPYEDDRFDVVFATSVYTHLQMAPTERYLGESARVLRSGGRLFATLYLVDAYAREAIENGVSDLAFERIDDGSYTTNRRDAEAAVGHDESAIVELLGSFGLRIEQDPARGNWNHRPDARRRQDVLVAVKS